MAGPYPLASLSATISAAGISAPEYIDILNSLVASAQGIFGTDIDLDSDTADGQFLAVFALAQKSANDANIAAYNAYSPASAVGAGLSSVVKVNGLQRQPSSNSTADVVVVGQTGTLISGGLVFDANGNQWALETPITIPFSGQIIVLATCATPGAVAAAPNTIGFGTAGTGLDTLPLNPVPGWQSTSNPNAAIQGFPVEMDAQLRTRQALSTGLPATGPLDSIRAAIGNIPGVLRLKVWGNTNDSPDLNGIPGHSIAAVVAGGDPLAIATAISRKILGCGTYGTTSELIYDSAGMPNIINFFALATVSISVAISIQARQGYVSTTGNLIAASVAAAISALDIGESVSLDDLSAPAKLAGDAATGPSGLSQTALDVLSKTYKVRSIAFGFRGGTLGTEDLIIQFYQGAICSVSDVVVTAF